MYIINAQVVHHTTDNNGVSYDKSMQIPTFLLDENIQGIVDENHAKQIAENIITPFKPQYEAVTVHINVVKTW